MTNIFSESSTMTTPHTHMRTRTTAGLHLHCHQNFLMYHKILNKAETSGKVRKTARKHKVQHKQIRQWRKYKHKLIEKRKIARHALQTVRILDIIFNSKFSFTIGYKYCSGWVLSGGSFRPKSYKIHSENADLLMSWILVSILL